MIRHQRICCRAAFVHEGREYSTQRWFVRLKQARALAGDDGSGIPTHRRYDRT